MFFCGYVIFCFAGLNYRVILNQDKNWGVLEVNRSECHRKIDNLSEKRTKPTLDQ